MKLEGIKGASGPYELFSFREPTSIKDCKVMSDAEFGGFSTAQLDWVEKETTTAATPAAAQQPPEEQESPKSPMPFSLPSSLADYNKISPSPKSSSPTPYRPSRPRPGYARFHGSISVELPPNRPLIERSGVAGFRTSDRPPTIFGRSFWDVEPWMYLALRVRVPLTTPMPGQETPQVRSWFVNIQTESVVPTDLHQHRLFPRRPGRWETVLIPWNDFVRTNHGFVVEPQSEIMRQRVRSVGFSLTDRVEGPYELHVERIWATKDESEATPEPDAADVHVGGQATGKDATIAAAPDGPPAGGLKNKHGHAISWGSER